MKRAFIVLLLIVIAALAAQSIADASDFHFYTVCKTIDTSFRPVFRVGLSSDENMEFETYYLGNGPAINITSPFYAGSVDDAFDVLIPSESATVTLTIQAFYSDGTVISHDDTLTWDTKAKTCTDSGTVNGADGKVDRTPLGNINNPSLSADANACYSPGHAVCTTDQEWQDGWYEIRKAYEKHSL